MKKKKLKLAIASMTCCEGCQVEILNLGEKLLDIFEIFELGNFSWVKEREEVSRYDVALIEGTPLTQEDFSNLKELRKKSKIIVAMGTCAHLGGVQEIKNYTEREKKEKVKYVYSKYKRIENAIVVPLSKVVKVDYIAPGCPINREELYNILSDIALGKSPKILPRPVCYECQNQGYECLLQKGEPCLGPITLGGCEAVCLKSNRFCYGCRGPLDAKNPVTKRHLDKLEKSVGKKYLREVLETFGTEDDFLK